MCFKDLNEAIKEDEQLLNTIKAIENSRRMQPYIVAETLKMLEDNSLLSKYIKDSNKIALCKMCKRFNDKISAEFMIGANYSSKINKSKITIYSVNINGNKRRATRKEIDNGVEELYSEEVYVAGERIYKQLSLLQWAFYGRDYDFRNAGYKLKYDKDGTVLTSFYDMILMCSNELNILMDEYKSSKFNRAIKIIEKNYNPYKNCAPDYAKDQISVGITVKQLVIDMSKAKFSRDDKELNRAILIAKKYNDSDKKNNKNPMEIAFIRKQYKKLASQSSKIEKENELDTKIKEMCNYIETGLKENRIRENHFAFKVIEYVKNNNYTKCSDKQMKYLEEAYDIVKNSEDKETVKESDDTAKFESIDEYSGISDILNIQGVD